MDHIARALEKAMRAGPARKSKSSGTAQPHDAQPEETAGAHDGPISESEVAPSKTSSQAASGSTAEVQDPAQDLVSPDQNDTSSRPSTPRSITYEQTRTNQVDPSLLAETRLIAGLKHDPRSTIFQMLRTQVLLKLRKEGWQTIGVTSPMPGAGKSLIAANLAVGISQEVNQTVLAIDMDLRRPSLAGYFGITPEYGLRDHLLNDVPLSKIFVNPGMERLVLIPGKGSVSDSAEVLSMPKTIQLVNEVKNRYESRLIIFDLPPILTTDDALMSLSQVDAVILVVEDGNTTKDQILQSLRLLEGTELMGTVLNKSNVPMRSEYY